MANEVAQLRRSEVAQPATTTLPTAVELVAGLRDAIAKMKPDDIILEMAAVCDGHRSSQRLSLRCYKKGRVIIDEEHDVE